ncbi:MAG: cadherin-like beta sandwich domain-containing protein [Pseudomonadales bacterium]
MQINASRVFLVLVLLQIGACGGGGGGDDAGPSRNPQLASLVLSQGTLTPTFESSTFDYTAGVANPVTSITVTPTTAVAAATVTVNGTAAASGAASAPIALTVGDTAIAVQVTAENGTTQRTYTVVVTRRPPPSSNAALTDLALSGTELDQLFDPAITAYTAGIGFFGAATRVRAVPEDAGATLTLDGEPLAAGGDSTYTPLDVGVNDLALLVTAEDGVATRAYDIEVTRAGAVSAGQEGYLKASNTGPDRFGTGVAISADTLAVGAPEEGSAATGIGGNQADNSLGSAGAVYLFERDGSTWRTAEYVKASNTDGVDRFGAALGLDTDLLAVGAPGEQSLASGIDGNEQDDSAAGVGAVYLFERDAMGVWDQSAYVKASNPDGGDGFGAAVAVSGERIIVGADLEDGGASGVDGDDSSNALAGAGAAYVFGRSAAGRWEQQAYLKASTPDAADRFGSAVAISGDLAAVGAPLEDSRSTGIDGDAGDNSLGSAGAVYLFGADAAGEFAPLAYVKASNTDSGDRFGAAVAVDGDLLAVGAPEEDSAAAGVDGNQGDDTLNAAGAVYVFERDGAGDFSQIAYLKAANPGSLDNFGAALALRGNILVVAAPGENSAATGIDGNPADESALNSGAVYVFERDGAGNFSQIAYLKASNTDAGDAFGGAVALDGDTVAVGAALEDGADTDVDGDDADDSLPGAGAAYVIR